jgi:hypothetical protein
MIFSKAETAEGGYRGGGGFLKRGWDQTMAPLKKAKSQSASLPTDMRSRGGAKAATVAENAAVWKAHGEGLGKYNADDPTYDATFAHEIEAELEDIALHEEQLAEHNIAAVIRSYSRPAVPSDTSTEAEREAHSPSAEIHHLMQKKPR